MADRNFLPTEPFKRASPLKVNRSRSDGALVPMRHQSPQDTTEMDVQPIAVENGAALVIKRDELTPQVPVYEPKVCSRPQLPPDVARQYLDVTLGDRWNPDSIGINQSMPSRFTRDLQILREQGRMATDDVGRRVDGAMVPYTGGCGAVNRYNGQGIGVPGYNLESVSYPIPMAIKDINSTDPLITTNTEPLPDTIREMINRTQLLASLEDHPVKKKQLQILIQHLISHGQLLNDAKNKRNVESTGITDAKSAVPTVKKVIGADGKEYLRFSPYVDVKTARITIENDGDIRIKGIKNQDIESIGASGFLDTHRSSMFFKALFWSLVASFVIFFLYAVAKFFSWLFCTDSCSGCKKKRSNCSC